MESTSERDTLRRIAPNHVLPMPQLLPIYQGGFYTFSKIRIGLALYDLCSRFRTFRLHRRKSREDTLRLSPQLGDDGLLGSFVYYDCKSDDVGLVMRVVMSAEEEGAIVANYLRFVKPLLKADGTVEGALLKDELDGGEISIRCGHIIYATGPYSDQVVSGSLARTRLISPSRGSYLVVPRRKLPVNMVHVLRSVDNRYMVVIPFNDFVTLIGNTDIPHVGSPDEPITSAEEADYLIASVNQWFPGAQIVRGDITATWAGLRPIIHPDALYENARERKPTLLGNYFRGNDVQSSREDRIVVTPEGTSLVVGGKLTTARLMGQKVLDTLVRVCSTLPRFRNACPCVTGKLLLDPFLSQVPISVQELHPRLWRHYGSSVLWFVARLEAYPEESSLLVSGLPCILAEVSYAVLCLHAVHLDDVMVRRVNLFVDAPDQGISCSRRVAEHMASDNLLSIDGEKKRNWIDVECLRYENLVSQSQAWQLGE